MFGPGLFWVCRFYYVRVLPFASVPRLNRVPLGDLLLAVCVFWTMNCLLIDLKLSLRQRMGRGLYALGMVLVVFFTVDLFLVNKGEKFRYSSKFHPFLSYDVGWAYGYSHATERTVTDLRGVSFTQKKPRGTVRVILNGASTMWGHAQRAERCPARVLSDMLCRADPGQEFEVITLAFPGKYQLNELIDTVVTLPHWQPDIVVSFNGFNEIAFGEREDRYEGMPYIAPQLEATVEVEPLLGCFYRYTHLGSVFWKRRLQRLQPRYGVEKSVVYEPPRYYSYLRLTARNFARMGVPYAYALCPNLYEKPTRSSEEEATMGQTCRGERADLGPEVRERRRISSSIVREEGQISYDAMAVFAHTGGNVFTDICHLNDQGVKLIMGDVAAHIPGWIAEWTAGRRGTPAASSSLPQ